MGIYNDGFEARIKRVQVKSRQRAPMPDLRHGDDDSSDGQVMSLAILLPQVAFVLGAIALIVGRAISMNTLMLEPSTDLLGLGEGCVIIILLIVFGGMFGKSNHISHGAMVIGASLAFLGESYYIRVVPELMKSIYNPEYVDLLLLSAR
jgi:hypothetical protein